MEITLLTSDAISWHRFISEGVNFQWRLGVSFQCRSSIMDNTRAIIMAGTPS